MAGVVNNCIHCKGVLYDEETACKNCSHCGKPDWNPMRVEQAAAKEETASSTITIYTVTEMADEEGRRWDTLDVVFSEDEATRLKGNSGYRRIETKTVFSSPPMLRGIEVSSWQALRRYPIDKILRDKEKMDKIMNKLSSGEMDFLKKQLK
jgi:hypothetical protein